MKKYLNLLKMNVLIMSMLLLVARFLTVAATTDDNGQTLQDSIREMKQRMIAFDNERLHYQKYKCFELKESIASRLCGPVLAKSDVTIRQLAAMAEMDHLAAERAGQALDRYRPSSVWAFQSAEIMSVADAARRLDAGETMIKDFYNGTVVLMRERQQCRNNGYACGCEPADYCPNALARCSSYGQRMNGYQCFRCDTPRRVCSGCCIFRINNRDGGAFGTCFNNRVYNSPYGYDTDSFCRDLRKRGELAL